LGDHDAEQRYQSFSDQVVQNLIANLALAGLLTFLIKGDVFRERVANAVIFLAALILIGLIQRSFLRPGRTWMSGILVNLLANAVAGGLIFFYPDAQSLVARHATYIVFLSVACFFFGLAGAIALLTTGLRKNPLAGFSAAMMFFLFVFLVRGEYSIAGLKPAWVESDRWLEKFCFLWFGGLIAVGLFLGLPDIVRDLWISRKKDEADGAQKKDDTDR
jgi:hypothetical protein